MTFADNTLPPWRKASRKVVSISMDRSERHKASLLRRILSSGNSTQQCYYPSYMVINLWHVATIHQSSLIVNHFVPWNNTISAAYNAIPHGGKEIKWMATSPGESGEGVACVLDSARLWVLFFFYFFYLKVKTPWVNSREISPQQQVKNCPAVCVHICQRPHFSRDSPAFLTFLQKFNIGTS